MKNIFFVVLAFIGLAAFVAFKDVPLQAGTVSNTYLANMAANTLKGNNTGSAATPADLTTTQVKTLLAISESDVASLTTDLAAKAPLASPTFTGTPAAPTAATGTSTTQVATTAFVQAATDYGTYSTILEASGSHTAARVAGTYALGDGDPIAISGTGTLYPIKTIYIAAADFPNVDGKAAKLRLRAQVYTNDVAPTGNYTFGLYPITRPATSGGAGLAIYTLGTVVTGSTVLFTNPAADGQLNGASSDFALPADGHYVIGIVTTAAVATSAHMHVTAQLQVHNN
jgi:hypothetical protein